MEIRRGRRRLEGEMTSDVQEKNLPCLRDEQGFWDYDDDVVHIVFTRMIVIERGTGRRRDQVKK